MPSRSLAEWLAYQEAIHPSSIAMGLERVAVVLARLRLQQPPFPALIVAGTNGKGSCVAMLEAALLASGRRVGAYTSPHLVRYNERVRVAGADLDDAALCDAFAAVEAARGDVPLTYFEFGTCAALVAMREAKVDAAVLEVGLGGRLDAVNAVSALGAAVTSIGLDHQDWLGADRDAIGVEKGGVYHAGRVAVCGDRAPPAAMLQDTAARGVDLWVREREFKVLAGTTGWDLHTPRGTWSGLPVPALAGAFQTDNAATACALLLGVQDMLPVSREAVVTGLSSVRVPGRLERIAGAVEHLLDVAHNPDAAAVLATHLRATRTAGRTLLVLGVLADKDAAGIARVLLPQVDETHAAGLGGPRGRSGTDLAALLRASVPGAQVTAHADVPSAHRAALQAARAGDRIVVCGSFLVVGEVRGRGVYSAAT